MEYMTGTRPGMYWVITWRYVGPVLAVLLFIAGLYDIGDKGIGYTAWVKEEVGKRYTCTELYIYIWSENSNSKSEGKM